VLTRPFGNTGLAVPILGLGTGHIGAPDLSEDSVGALLNAAVDLGVTLFDSAPSYGMAEERLGRHLAHRRKEIVLSTKCGYGVPGVPDWTGECIRAGVELALRRMRTEVIDILFLHSCPEEVLVRDDIQGALEAVVAQGKVRVAGYSGDGAPLKAALEQPAIRGLQASINLCDQQAISQVLPVAKHKSLGVIAKRPLANAPWRFAERPVGHYAEVYWTRLRTMGIDPSPLEWGELALRFSAYVPGVATCIVGTHRPEHLRQHVEWVSHGPLERSTIDALRQAFLQHGEQWGGQV
jgi:aryl-alcohol dehydrogenase-like predicted oxidoreductase